MTFGRPGPFRLRWAVEPDSSSDLDKFGLFRTTVRDSAAECTFGYNRTSFLYVNLCLIVVLVPGLHCLLIVCYVCALRAHRFTIVRSGLKQRRQGRVVGWRCRRSRLSIRQTFRLPEPLSQELGPKRWIWTRRPGPNDPARRPRLGGGVEAPLGGVPPPHVFEVWRLMI